MPTSYFSHRLMIFKKKKKKKAARVDELVMARILPDDLTLAETVKKQLTHGPCGPGFNNSSCMKTERCSKGYPKRWCEETIIADGSS